MHPEHPGPRAGHPRGRQDATVTLVSLLLLLLWDASGLDMAAASLFGSAAGFEATNSFLLSRVMHDGGRLLAWLLLALLLLAALRAAAGADAVAGVPGRAERWRWIGVTLLCVVAVPALKRLSSTSCPWDLAAFGGAAQHLSHWRWGVPDGGAGHCFPSGHAVAAFAFIGQYFLWRDVNARRARIWLLTVLVTGAVFGLAQLARGAHFPSHTLWSAWFCWCLCAGAAATTRRRVGRTLPHNLAPAQRKPP